MILLDTDHVSILKYHEDPRCQRLSRRLDAVIRPEIATSIVSVEEQMRGWLAQVHRTPSVLKQVLAYTELASLLRFFSEWQVVPFDDRAADEFQRLRKERVRIGSMDLKIASIAIVHDALLLSANLRDFSQVPGLQVESWVD